MKHHCRHSHLCRQVTINVDECVELLMLAGNFLCWHILEKLVKQACLSLFMHMACIMKSDARWSFCQFHNCLIIVEFTVIKALDFLSRKILRPCSLKLWFLRKEKEARILLIQNTDKYFLLLLHIYSSCQEGKLSLTSVIPLFPYWGWYRRWKYSCR